jgi:tRNA-dependent cyclodipeptide synthase
MDIPDTDHLIIGMSPFNPHFSLGWIISAFRWGADHFATVDVLHPGAIATSLLTATGTPEGRALRRARQQCSKKLRTVAAAVEQSGVVLGRTSPLLISDHIVEPNYAGRREQVADEYLRNTEVPMPLPGHEFGCHPVTSSSNRLLHSTGSGYCCRLRT